MIGATHARGRQRSDRSVAALCILAVAALLAPAIALGGSSSSVDGANGSSSADIQSAIDFRREFGLRSDPGFVEGAQADESLSRVWGPALTSAEIAEMDRRVQIQESLEPLTAFLDQQPGFAGIYIDQAAGGVLVISTTGGASELQPAVARLVPADASVRVQTVEYSAKELDSLQSSITSDWQALAAAGLVVASVGVDVVANRVRVAVADVTASQEAQLTDVYGPATEVVPGHIATPGACNSRTDCGSPLKGGLSIQATVGTTVYTCTSGFLGRPDASFTQLYVLTAGHCLQDSGLSATWKHHGVAIGTGAFEHYYNNSRADIGDIRASEAGAKNKVYASSNTDIRSITAELPNSSQVYGGAVPIDQLPRGGLTVRLQRNTGTGWHTDAQVDATVRGN